MYTELNWLTKARCAAYLFPSVCKFRTQPGLCVLHILTLWHVTVVVVLRRVTGLMSSLHKFHKDILVTPRQNNAAVLSWHLP